MSERNPETELLDKYVHSVKLVRGVLRDFETQRWTDYERVFRVIKNILGYLP